MSRRRGLLGCLATAVVVTSIVAVGALALRGGSRRADEKLRARWSAALGGQSFLERFPPTEPNETVRRLETLGAAMGLEMVYAEAVGGPRPDQESTARFSAIGPQLKEYLRATEWAESRAARPTVSAGLDRFLADVQPQVVEVAALIRDASLPVWESDISRGFDAPLPHFLGVLQLQQILVARAGLEAGSSRPRRALELLETSWRLNQAVLARVSFVPQLVGQQALVQQASVLRGLCGVPRSWRARLKEVEFQKGIFVALQAEAFMAYHSASMDPIPGADYQAYSVPFLRWGMHDYAHRFQRILADLAAEDVRTVDPEAFLDRASATLPRWQIIARILLPNMFSAWPQSARHELEAELTEHVLAQRAALATRPTRPLLVTGPAQRESRRVPGLTWLFETDADGVSIRLDGDLAYKEEDAPPLRFRVERADCPAGT